MGVADFPSLWNQKIREGLDLHWDGNNNSVQERNISAALGAGATPVTLDRPAMKRIENWIYDELLAPKYKDYMGENTIDKVRADKGKLTYQERCAECHDRSGNEKLPVIPLKQIGTDPERFWSYTPELMSQQYTLGTGQPWRLKRFRKTNGYASMPLDGIWARAPYLHNGSVPTLWDLLKDPKDRPQKFWRGYDVYDSQNVGFISDRRAERGGGTFFDTSRRGNGNEGHSGWSYGTTGLTEDQKRDLLEYVKSL